jgi:hypothetical protein
VTARWSKNGTLETMTNAVASHEPSAGPMQKHDNGEEAQPQGRPLSPGAHALMQQAGIEERGHDDGGEDREIEPEADDRDGAGGGKQCDRPRIRKIADWT